MRQISLVGAVDEEVGDYFPEFLGMLEESPFLKVRLNECVGPSVFSFFQNKWGVLRLKMSLANISKQQLFGNPSS